MQMGVIGGTTDGITIDIATVAAQLNLESSSSERPLGWWPRHFVSNPVASALQDTAENPSIYEGAERAVAMTKNMRWR